MSAETLETLDKRFRNACKVILKGEVGGLVENEKWLTRHLERSVVKKSTLSGKDVSYQIAYYGKGSKWAGLDEIGAQSGFAPLSLNDIKDIDSIASAIQDRAYYVGNVVLGNSKFVERSANISDSFYVYRSSIIADSQYVAYCNNSRSSDTMFGCEMTAEDSFLIKCHGLRKGKRCFEVWQSDSSSDCLYSQNIQNRTNCMFCFNVRSKNNAIGNLELPREKYAKISASLLEQVRSDIGRSGGALSLVDIAGKYKAPKEGIPCLPAASGKLCEAKTDRQPIEKAFSNATALLFSKRLTGIDQYESWLGQFIRKVYEYKSAFSGKRILVAHYANFELLPNDRLIDLDETEAAGSLKIGQKEAEGITYQNAAETIAPVAFMCPVWRVGKSMNMIDCVTELDAANCYRTVDCIFSKYAAFCFWPRSSEHVFGCNSVFDSSHSIRCYFSKSLTRCFEVDASHDCSDCYFSHNLDNCHDCMFCFNVKNLKYAIGNVEVGKEEYAKAKKLVLSELASRLEKDKKLPWSIYTIGAKA